MQSVARVAGKGRARADGRRPSESAMTAIQVRAAKPDGWGGVQ
jgi:hypothetical protein